MSFGKNILGMRRDKGWTLSWISDSARIKVGHLSKLEHDEGDPKLSTLYKQTNAFSCSPDSLLTDLNRINTDGILTRQDFKAGQGTEAWKGIHP